MASPSSSETLWLATAGMAFSTLDTLETQAAQPSVLKRKCNAVVVAACRSISCCWHHSRQAVWRASASGISVSTVARVVAAAVGAHCHGRGYATTHASACTVTVSATKVGRSGPSVVLNPAHPNEKALSMICSAQQEEDSNPSSDHQAILCAATIICSLSQP